MGVCRNFSRVGATSSFLLIFFRLLTLQCSWTFTKHFTVFTPLRICPTKACAPFASSLKYFSSGAAYEFATKSCIRIFHKGVLSSVTAYAELAHKCRYHCELHTTRGVTMGEQGGHNFPVADSLWGRRITAGGPNDYEGAEKS